MYTKNSRPGKYEGNKSQLLASILHEASLNGYCEEEASLSEYFVNWHGLIEGKKYSFLLHENDQGFFDYEVFKDQEEARRKFSIIANSINKKPGHEEMIKKLHNSGRIENISFKYKETGYKLEEGQEAILLANWNEFSDLFQKYLSQFYALEWLDEWIECCHCNGIVRSVANSYSWKPSFFWISECELVCHECLKENIEWLEEGLEEYINNPEKCLDSSMAWLLLEKGEGDWLKLDEKYYSGLHEGMNARPEKILEALNKYYEEVIFIHEENSQFYITFSCMVKGEKENGL